MHNTARSTPVVVHTGIFFYKNALYKFTVVTVTVIHSLHKGDK